MLGRVRHCDIQNNHCPDIAVLVQKGAFLKGFHAKQCRTQKGMDRQFSGATDQPETQHTFDGSGPADHVGHFPPAGGQRGRRRVRCRAGIAQLMLQ